MGWHDPLGVCPCLLIERQAREAILIIEGESLDRTRREPGRLLEGLQTAAAVLDVRLARKSAASIPGHLVTECVDGRGEAAPDLGEKLRSLLLGQRLETN